jgi:hypothetical protein
MRRSVRHTVISLKTAMRVGAVTTLAVVIAAGVVLFRPSTDSAGSRTDTAAPEQKAQPAETPLINYSACRTPGAYDGEPPSRAYEPGDPACDALGSGNPADIDGHPPPHSYPVPLPD